jgi:hypothetical protein
MTVALYYLSGMRILSFLLSVILYFYLWPVPPPATFFYVISQKYDFPTKSTERKMGILIFYTNFV